MLEEKVSEARNKFERACQQIVLLDQKIKDLEIRYRRAVKNKKNSFRYNLRLRFVNLWVDIAFCTNTGQNTTRQKHFQPFLNTLLLLRIVISNTKT